MMIEIEGDMDQSWQKRVRDIIRLQLGSSAAALKRLHISIEKLPVDSSMHRCVIRASQIQGAAIRIEMQQPELGPCVRDSVARLKRQLARLQDFPGPIRQKDAAALSP